MKIFALILIAAVSAGAAAETLTCELRSGGQATSASVNIPAGLGEYVVADSVHDLSFNLIVECARRKCTANITIDSGILEDEAGSTAFEFTSGGTARNVFTEPVTNAPDGRAYEISCATGAAAVAPAIRARSGLFYLEGHAVNQPVRESTYIGAYRMCFKGNPESARRKIWNYIRDDIEKQGPFARYDRRGDYVIYGYTDHKCLDEGNDASDCYTSQRVARCQN